MIQFMWFVFQSLNYSSAWLVFQSLNYIVCVFCVSVTELYQFVWFVFQSLNDTFARFVSVGLASVESACHFVRSRARYPVPVTNVSINSITEWCIWAIQMHCVAFKAT